MSKFRCVTSNVLIAIALMSGCSNDSVSTDDAGFSSYCRGRYEVKKSIFFGEAYRIVPLPPAGEILAICATEGAAGVRLVCEWATRRAPSDEGGLAPAVDDAYWPLDEAVAMVVRLNKCSSAH